MKRFLLLFIALILPFQVFAEQYLLQCSMNIESVNTLNNTVMSKSIIERYFIIDTILAEVYDANNLPLAVESFTDETIVFHHKTGSFNTLVDTQITYNQVTKKITLNEVYANTAYSSQAGFITRGEGSCSVKEIERKPIF